MGDLAPPDALHLVFVRSPHARARILSVGPAAALAHPGVAAVLTAADLAGHGAAAVNPLLPIGDPRPFEPLAGRQVRAVGQAVAAVIAATAEAAGDAAELVAVDYEDEEAGEEAAPVPAFEAAWRHGDIDAAFAAAPLVATAQVRHARVAAMPMEPRTALAAWDEAAGLTAWLSTQTPHRARQDLSAILGLPADRVRVIAPDVGGAFGGKASLFPEDAVVAWAARLLGRPVLWRGTRAEDLLAGTHGRGATNAAEAAIAADGTLLGLRVRLDFPLGHWLPYSAVVPGRNAGRILPGPYRCPALATRLEGRVEAAAAVGIYRGAGRPEAAMLMERLMDEAARTAGLDPLEIRRRNLRPAHAVPCAIESGETLDSGDYAAVLDAAAALADYPALRRRQAERRAAGELVGIGIGLYVEPCGQGWESARLSVEADGRIVAATGSTAQGQGRETAFAQIVADALGVPPETVTVRHGDTAAVPPGIGALASRSTAIGGGALVQAAAALRAAALPLAARLLQARPGALGSGPDSVEPCAGGFRNPATGAFAAWAAIAEAAPGGTLSAGAVFEAGGEAWSSGCCIAAAAIDRDTGVPTVEGLWLADDAGVVVNPLLVEGQLLGGVAQGLGEALMERIVYDADGQLLTGSLADYALPRAADMPPVRLTSLCTPSPANPLGAKGVGEAGCIGVPAAIANAVHDALAPLGVGIPDLPLTGERIWRAIHGPRNEEEPA